MYFRHLVKYILFLRILSQDEILPHDIEFSRILIHEFLSEFKQLYGEKQQTFNLHCLQHLPNQVQNRGPLHKSDCFPFEGWFKNTKSLHSGTRNISSQIADNLNLKLKIHFELQDVIIRKQELKDFVQKMMPSKTNNKHCLTEPILTKEQLWFDKSERNLIKNKFDLPPHAKITFSYHATINNISKIIFLINLTSLSIL